MTKYQDPVSKEDLYVYLEYLLTGQVKSERNAKDIQRLARRTATLSDVSAVVKVAVEGHRATISEIMDRILIMTRLLEKLGATEKMFKEAKEEHDAFVKEQTEALQAALAEKGVEVKADEE